MKNIKNTYRLLFVVLISLLAFSCDDEKVYVFDENIVPTDFTVDFTIEETEDETTITVAPNAQSANQYQIFFGDEENEEPTIIFQGETKSHTYTEDGEYTLRVLATSVTGATSEYVRVIIIADPVVIIEPPIVNDVLNLPIDFESSDLVYDFEGFGSANAAIIENPDATGNNSSKVLEINKPSGANTWAGAGMSVDGALDFSTSTFVSVNVWSPRAGTPILFKIEDTTSPIVDGIHSIYAEVEVPTTLAEAWEVLTFDMTLDGSFDANTAYNKVVLFPDFGTAGADEIFYFDDIFFSDGSGVVTPPTESQIYDDFEGNGTITTWTEDNAAMDLDYANPYIDTNNDSVTVLRYIDNGSGQYANIRFDAPSSFDLTTESKFTLKIYIESSSLTGAQPNQISLKLQDGTASQPWVLQTEIIKELTLDTWQEVTFDFANDITAGQADPLSRTDFNRIVLQVNSENNYDAVTAYIDDFSYGELPVITDPEPSDDISDDFEGNGTITTWAEDNAAMDLNFANPYIDTNNDSDTVLEYVDNGSGQYANIRFDAPTNFDLTTKNKFTLKIYIESSSITGTQPNQISLKLQDGTANEPWALQTEIIKEVTPDTWQELTFDFANDVTAGQADPLSRTDFNRIVLQVNSENNFDAVTAYIDDFNYHN